MDKDFALLYGIMLGDGCIGKYKRKDRENGFYYNVCITCNANDDWPFINSVVLPLLKRFTGRDIKPRKANPGKNVIQLNFSDKGLFSKLDKTGFPVGKKGTKITIPNIFYKRKLIKYLLQGFFATDGSFFLIKNPNKYYPRLEIQVISKDLLKEFYIYLNNLGIKTHFYMSKSNKPKKWKNEFQRYRIQINGKKNLILFRNKVGFVNPKQENKFKNFIKYDLLYNKTIKGIPANQQKFVRIEGFLRMALRGFEPPITSFLKKFHETRVLPD